MNKYIYVDLETTCNGGPDGDSPEAHWANNYVLLAGWCINQGDIYVTDNVKQLRDTIQHAIETGHQVTIVAHNAKFDLKYLMRDCHFVQWDEVSIWDTMTWEYRASGQSHKMWSLEGMAKEYGIPFKKSLNLGALLDSGVKMESIDTKMLAAYLEDDVKALREVHQLQGPEVFDMDYLLPLAEMELNGMEVNVPAAEVLATSLVTETSKIEVDFIKHLTQSCEWQDGSPLQSEDFTDQIGTKSKYIKPLSNRTVSFLLTGKPDKLVVTPKWQVQHKDGFSPYYRGTIPPYFGSNYSNLGYPVDEHILSQDGSWIAQEVLEYRKANKLMSTYIGPMLATAKVQGTIYPRLNTAVTSTGRLSSSQPNGQNMPPEARKLIVGNEIVELDFSQLELVAVACISGDKNLIRDLNNGVDIHYNTAAMVFGKDNAKTMRKIAKNVNFGLLYGGKATGLSHQTGVDKGKVQKLIDAFYSNYPQVAVWQKDIFNSVVDNMHPWDVKDGEQRYSSMYTEPLSKRKFRFIEQTSPPWLRRRTGRKFSFSPQQTSNFPIQGFAGGDIVMNVLTRLWRMLPDVRFLMTVHDSIIMETQKDLVPSIDKALKDVENYYELPVNLKYDLTNGPHWS